MAIALFVTTEAWLVLCFTFLTRFKIALSSYGQLTRLGQMDFPTLINWALIPFIRVVVFF